jgi:class 3 adenylate cyclase
MPLREAFVVEGAHLYGQLLDFDDLVTEHGQETEAAHRRLLRFLNIHYRVWDSLVDGDDGDRIDYHGARLHAVIASPIGDPAAQIERAVALARKLTEAARKVGGSHGFPSRIRFGIDHGKCLAMTTGRGAHEKDTLFLGRPANHAAKLVASGAEQGIFLTETVQAVRRSMKPMSQPLRGGMPSTAWIAPLPPSLLTPRNRCSASSGPRCLCPL